MRYTINKEFCGYEKKRWVVRFCGKWLGESADRTEAEAIAVDHSST